MYSRINSLLDNQFHKYNRKKKDFNLIIDSDLCNIQCYVYEFDMICIMVSKSYQLFPSLYHETFKTFQYKKSRVEKCCK